MDIKLPIKIHNRFDIEVKDIITGEIVQRGYAENIILDNYLSTTTIHSSSTAGYFGYSLQFGKGTGTLLPSRTTLFNRIGGKDTTLVELVVNQPPLTSYATVLCTILANEYVGETITEVGVSAANNDIIFTHALIKDSEGNPLSLGPKTNLQEILIYSTRYLVPNFGDGIRFYTPIENSLVAGFLGTSYNTLRKTGNDTTIPRFYLNESTDYNTSLASFPIGNSSAGKMVLTPKKRLDTGEFNGKIKKITWRSHATQIYQANALIFDFIAMAEGNSTVWSGYEFDKIPVGVGNGNKTIFNLTWDEVWLTKPYKVYVDGVEVNAGFTFNDGNITFDIAPADSAVITVDYWVKYVPKDSNHVLDFNIEFLYGEGIA